MRIVYDDEKQSEFVNAVEKFMDEYDPKKYIRYEHGTDRVQMDLVKKGLNRFLKSYKMEIGNTVTHAYGIGNNCCYPVYYHTESEIQQCANINLNTGMYGEGYVSVEDYNGKKIGHSHELNKWGGVQKK